MKLLVCGVDEAGRGPCEIHRRSFDPVRAFFERDLFSES
jgi:ribonuclease HII